MARIVTVCAVEDCTKLSGVPGTARSLCSGHYQKWKKWGDPLADLRRKRTFCTVDGCKKPCAGRGLCGAHWYHWKTHGDPTHRLPGEVVDGKRICSRCRIDKPLEDYGRHRGTTTGRRSYCLPCSQAKTAGWRLAHPEYVPPPRDPEKQRKFAIEYRRRNPGYMSSYRQREAERTRAYSKEWRRRHPDAVRAHSVARRVRRHHAFVEHVRPSDVYQRDGWQCGICLQPIDSGVANPDPMSPSIDHIVPLSRHGKHSMANVQAAHLVCNMRKGVKDLALVVGHFSPY